MSERIRPQGVLTAALLPECWNCHAEVDQFVCGQCGKIQPIPREWDYFTSLGMKRRFEFDEKRGEALFHSLSRTFHPDFYQNRSSAEQEISLENASRLNKAYRTLKDPISRMEYLIELESADREGIRCQVPPDLLEEVLELHSELEILHRKERSLDDPEIVRVRNQMKSELARLETRFRELEEGIAELCRQWDRIRDASLPDRKEDGLILKEIRDRLSQRTYLSNVIEDIRRNI